MANQLTSSGLAVGSGTITNFIPAFGSNVVGTGSVTVTIPSSGTSMPSSPAVGTVYKFNVHKYSDSNHAYVTLPSSGVYSYGVKSSGSSDEVSGNVTFTAFSKNAAGGAAIAYANGSNTYGTHIYAGGGLVRIA